MIPHSHAVLIAPYLEPESVEQIHAASRHVRVIYEPSLLPPPRYPADHTSIVARSAEQETQWQALLAEATIMFDFDHTHRQDLPERAPDVRWLHASSAGIGQFVRRMGYDRR